MAQNISDQFASELMGHSVDLGRFETHEREILLRLFRDLEAQLIAQLQRVDPTAPSLSVYQRQRAERLLAYVRPIITSAYRDMATTEARDLRALAVSEDVLMRDLGAELVVDTMFSVGVPESTLRALVSEPIIAGEPLRTWWSRQATTTFQRYADTIRAGIVRGDSTSTIVRTLRGTQERGFTDGVFGQSRRNLSALVNTSVQSIAQQARLATLQANRDVVKGWEWLTALDSQVCERCRPYSGQAWTLDGRRLPGTKLPYPGPPPLHVNCRCQVLVIVKDYSALRSAKGPRFQAEVEAVSQETKDALDGGLGVDLSLPVWLQAQPVSVQRQMLGATRHAMWAAGKLSLTAMVSAATGRPLTLEQLKARRRRRVA